MKKLNNLFLVGLLLSLILPIHSKAYEESINIDISQSGVIPAFSLNCSGKNASALLISGTYPFQKSVEVYMRRPCVDGVVNFDSFDLNDWLTRMGDAYPAWTNYFSENLLLVVKDTTTLYAPDAPIYNQIINLWGSQNNYDRNSLSPDDSYYPTIGVGPKFNFNGSIWKNEHKVIVGNSSVMFFPGVMGSRLYENGNELWVSQWDSDQEKLTLKPNGESLNNVYTKDDTQNINDESETGIIDEVYGSNIYNSFINDLRNWKSEGVIKDYAFIPYDWRLSLEDIITNGATTTDGKLSYSTAQDFSESFILKKLAELAKNSNSGKVTIIAHSNGGLVTKALVKKLKDTNNPLYYKIDKIILVAVPQIGTPDAVATLLHGTSLASGFVMRDERSRQLAENMQTVYNLLPTDKYFSSIDPTYSSDKVVSFLDDVSFQPQISQYGLYVSNSTELKNYILGTDGRTKPGYKDTDNPNIGNATLYSNAEAVHVVLDNWQPASTTKFIQVAGWGEETLAGIDYKKCRDTISNYYHKCFSFRMVVDGDGTVLTPSALWMSTTSPNVERWWVNLDKYNSTFNLNLKRKHRDIMEITNINDLIKSLILNSNYSDSGKIITTDQFTLITNGSRLHYTLHSPLTLGVTDSQGRYTGMDPVTKNIREEIPGVVYRQIGDTQYISIPEEISHTLNLKGYDNGSFSLDIDEQRGNNANQITSFQGIPSSISTIAILQYSSGVNLASTTLVVDINGDGNSDISLKTKLGEIVNSPYYKWDGFLQPINDTKYHPDQSQSVFKGGSTVPVKFQIKDFSGNIIVSSVTPKWLVPEKLSPMSSPVSESVTSTTATFGSDFRWDSASQQYIYNWSTKGLTSGYWYKISAKLDDGYIYSVIVGLK